MGEIKKYDELDESTRSVVEGICEQYLRAKTRGASFEYVDYLMTELKLISKLLPSLMGKQRSTAARDIAILIASLQCIWTMEGQAPSAILESYLK